MTRKNEKPDIRFSGFTDAWEQRKLGEIYTERNERGDDSLPILSVSIHHGISNGELDSNTLGKKVRRSEDKSLYKHVYFGDLVLNMMRAWQGAIGVVKSEGMVSPAYITAIPSAQLYPLFMDYCLRRDEMIIQMNNLSYGVTDFRKRLYWDSFIKVMCRIPALPEQKRITAFFTQLDNLITLHQSKYDKLVIVKKSMLEKMFPKDGSNVPEIRFAGFTDAWEQRKLGDVVDVRSGKDYKHLSEGTIPVYGTGGYMLSVNEALSYDENAIGIGRKGTIDKPYILKAPFWTVDTLFYAIPRKNNDLNFVFAIFQRIDWKNKDESTGVPSLSKTAINDIEILITKVEEQRVIGDFFSHLDNLITLHRRKLEKLKNIKKAMLGKMFV
ncbi:restriction endonuclease subunit S [Cohnella sp. LGH]|uniref:restriction endonuclease subunit S n=1 Tax=Cohnella sp. LGH TaxID=1619153 RepID=UPI001FFDF9D0|nr:restriction endonuclease subunit S [Cohnella sp. LGH]